MLQRREKFRTTRSHVDLRDYRKVASLDYTSFGR